MRTLEVVLDDRSYPIHIGSGLLARAGDLLGGVTGRRAIVVTNATVAAHHGAPLRKSLASRDIGVDEAQRQPARELTPERRFAGAHQTNQK